MNEKKLADVIILARGGGSLEDLWPFNEEIVAKAIYNSELPVISAVGHETDFTIADFVADLRAPTPSAAAELAVPNIADVELKLNTYQNRLKLALNKKYEMLKLRYEKIISSSIFKDPTRMINDRAILLDKNIKRIETAIQNKKQEQKEKYVKLISKLDALSPLKTLARGYSIIEQNGEMVNSVKQLKSGTEIDIKLVDGNSKAKII